MKTASKARLMYQMPKLFTIYCWQCVIRW